MPSPDLNLLVTLDVLLAEGSVVRAARRLRLSPSAMSRALARLRATTGDPLLVRAGRGLVLTPRALKLRDRVHLLVQDAEAVLRPDEALDLGKLKRTFTLRTSDGFVEAFAPALLARIAQATPGVRLHFLQKPDKDSTPLREGRVDLETGVIEGSLGPEIRSQALFRDRLVGVVRAGHPLVKGKGPDQNKNRNKDRDKNGGRMSLAKYVGAEHVLISRSGLEKDAVDRPFLPPELKRSAGTIVSGFAAALALARASDLVATVPDRHTADLRGGMFTFSLPVPTREFTVSMLWHPRMDADPAHKWLRACLREVCESPKT